MRVISEMKQQNLGFITKRKATEIVNENEPFLLTNKF